MTRRRRTPQQRKAASAWMKALHGRRRKRKKCINNEEHGRSFKGGRCRACWKTKLAAERTAYAEARR